MQQSYIDIQKQISELQKQAESARRQEVGMAIKEAKRLISVFALTAEDLGLSVRLAKPAKTLAVAGKSAKAIRKNTKKSSGDKRSAVAPKYRDLETGETWTGRGKPPKWLKSKLDAGATLEQFKIGPPAV